MNLSPERVDDEKENIRVHLRLRPMSNVESSLGDVSIWKMGDSHVEVDKDVYNTLIESNSQKVNFMVTNCKKQKFNFNACFSE